MRKKVNLLYGILKWFYPGIRIKRWIFLSVAGVVLVVVGSLQFRTQSLVFIKVLDIIVLSCGVVLLILGVKRLLRSFIMVFLPGKEDKVLDIMYQKAQLQRGARIVAIGGGTGLSALLEGLKEYTSNISAVVTVADDGGSSGRLREQFDILPPGDIRNCLVALADAPELMRQLFQFRFAKNSEFSGHSFGNLFITVMTQLTGDFEQAIRESSRVLAIRGRVIPSTLNKVILAAQYKDGLITEGEAQIPKRLSAIDKVYLRPQNPAPTPEAIKAIEGAQVIVLGPGSLYTSIIPNLLIRQISQAIISSPAIKIYVCNIMTQAGETDNYTASDHLRAIVKHSAARIVDYCIVNSQQISKELRKRYQQENAYPILVDIAKIRTMGYQVIEDDLVTTHNNLVRHNSKKLARIILSLVEEA
jgi:uncharacterized cofD-like protein